MSNCTKSLRHVIYVLARVVGRGLGSFDDTVMHVLRGSPLALFCLLQAALHFSFFRPKSASHERKTNQRFLVRSVYFVTYFLPVVLLTWALCRLLRKGNDSGL